MTRMLDALWSTQATQHPPCPAGHRWCTRAERLLPLHAECTGRAEPQAPDAWRALEASPGTEERQGPAEASGRRSIKSEAALTWPRARPQQQCRRPRVVGQRPGPAQPGTVLDEELLFSEGYILPTPAQSASLTRDKALRSFSELASS